MSVVVSMRLKEPLMHRLRRLARRLGRTPSETSALLVEEALRRAEFGFIVFRDSPAGRQAYIEGSGLAAWEVVELASRYDMDAVRTARHLHWPVARVQAALNYAAAYPDEIAAAREDNEAYTFELVSRMLPGAERFSAGPPAGGPGSRVKRRSG